MWVDWGDAEPTESMARLLRRVCWRLERMETARLQVAFTAEQRAEYDGLLSEEARLLDEIQRVGQPPPAAS